MCRLLRGAAPREPHFSFSQAKITEEGPLGVTFNINQPMTVVAEVRAKGQAVKHLIKKGDHLLEVNGVDVSDLPPSKSVKVIASMPLPRRLKFKVSCFNPCYPSSRP